MQRHRVIIFVIFFAAAALGLAGEAVAQTAQPALSPTIATAPGNPGAGGRPGAWIVLPLGLVNDDGNVLTNRNLNQSLVPCSGNGRCRPVYRVYYCESPTPAAGQGNVEQVQCYATAPLP